MSSSNPVDPFSQFTNRTFSRSSSITVSCEDRWQVYHRLQELNIHCQCGGFQPLEVEIKTATEAVQLWSIARRVSQPREKLATALEKNWRRACSAP